MKITLFAGVLFVALALVASSFLQITVAQDGTGLTGDALTGLCKSKCADRCKVAGMQDRCLKYCGICCLECKCVPSGTHSHKDECPCYRDKKNKKNQPKCP